MVRHALMTVEQLSGNLIESLRHGWVAVATYESEERRTRCMAGLAGTLVDYGDREAAEDAWEWVAQTSRDHYYLIYAHDALGHLAALRGDRHAFERRSERCDALQWEVTGGFAKAEILYYRGLSYRALGDVTAAEAWLRRAADFSEEHKYNRVLFRAEGALRSLGTDSQGDREGRATEAPVAPTELREGLRTMRRELALSEV